MKTEEIILAFLKDHFQRIFFSIGVLAIAWGLWLVGEIEAAKTLIVAVATLWLNKARSPKDESKTG